MAALEILTLGFVRELASGESIVVLAADPGLASFGDEEDALLEARLFLTEYLARVEPEVVARFALPEATTLHETYVLAKRDDLARRWNVATSIVMPSLVIPTVPNTKGKRDRWVVVLPLGHTLFVPHDEDLDERITTEVGRILAARELSPLDYLALLPAEGERLVPLRVEVHRSGERELRAGADVRRRLAEAEANKLAIEVLESVGDALHVGLARVTPRVFPLRDRELELLRTTLASSTRASALIVGPARVGKSALLRAWLEREHEVNRPRLVFATSGARLVAGMSGFGQWQERVRRVMEAAERLDAVLWFDDLGDLFADRPGGHVDIPSAMRPFLDDARVRVAGAIQEDFLERVEAQNAGFFACFGRVRLAPLDAEGARQVLSELRREAKTREPDRPFLSESAITALVDLAARYLPYESFPGQAVGLASELRGAQELALGSEARGAEIGPDAVYEAFSLRTGVPHFLLRSDHALEVDDLFGKLRARVIGQDAACRRIAELVCVVKAGLQPGGKPLATLLFVGPTGVGKTELARALAELLFGSEDRLVRFDMSEYASAYATERLFRGNDDGEGLLTRKVREQPFSVVLLDEIEKAHPAAFDLLLQVFGEGRLTDGRGKTAFFHNAIVIMTSNLGAPRGTKQTLGLGAARGDVDDARYLTAVRETFRPELVNRIDRIVPFRPLGDEDVRAVTRLATARATRRRGIVERGLELEVSEAALLTLAEAGKSGVYGARALRRHVERALLAPIARVVSGWGALEGERVVVTAEHEPEMPAEAVTVAGGLRFGVVRVAKRRGRDAEHGLDAITAMRRTAHRQLLLDRVVSMKDQVAFLVAQLGYGGGKRKKKDALDGRILAGMQSEHAGLAGLTERLDRAYADLCAIEELALVGFLEGQPLGGLRDEAEAAHARFQAALVHALVSQEPKKHAATIMVRELDSRRGLDRWLLPLLADAERRKWRITVHFDGDKEPGWPTERRWGPPRPAEVVRERVADRERTFRNVVLHVEGDHAGIWMALEGGLHRWNTAVDPEPAHLHVVLLALRATLADSEWSARALEPPNAQVAKGLSGGPATREHRETPLLSIAGGAATLDLPREAYWPRFEEIALAHLLVFENEAAKDRDALFDAVLDDGFGGVRELVAKRMMIDAIKLYRTLTGAGLKEAKSAVEAMS